MFKKETGTTVIGFLTQYRIHKAMELLRDCRRKRRERFLNKFRHTEKAKQTVQ